MGKCLLVGGSADGRRLNVPDRRPYIDIAIPPERCLSPQMGDSMAEDLSFFEERYCIFPFWTPQGEVILYASEDYTPRDVLNQLIERYEAHNG